MRRFSARQTVGFMVVLCLLSALTLAILATGLQPRQLRARQLDQAKQMLVAAHILNPKGYLEHGDTPDSLVNVATDVQILKIFHKRIKPYLTNDLGDKITFAEAQVDLNEYISSHQAQGYSSLSLKLFYEILSDDAGINPSHRDNESVSGYLIPVAGFGLWGPIFGYLALGADADTVLGVTWNAPMETPGLGAIISESTWQAQFQGKEIFLPPPEGSKNYAEAPLGLTVVKGKVRDVYGNSPKSQTAVDGISGATLTCNGVTAAYQRSLQPYRPLLMRIRAQYEEKNGR